MAKKWQRKAVSAGVVYFVEADGTGLIKIGFTSRPLRFRLCQLRAQSPTPLVVLGLIDARPVVEKKIHARFVRLWSHGEWFRGDDELREFIGTDARPWEVEPLPAGRPIVSFLEKKQTVAEWAEVTEVTVDGQTRTVLQWCRIRKMSVLAVKLRVNQGCDLARALNPFGNSGRFRQPIA